MEHAFERKVAIVTGASRGIGESVARRLLGAGAFVCIFSRSASPMRELEHRYRERTLAVSGDIANPADVERLFNSSRERFGPCEVLINNAGTLQPRLLVDMSLEEWDRQMIVNLRSVFDASRHALPDMIELRSGNIVNVASISGVSGTQKFPGLAAYCAAKAGVIGLTEALAAEVAEYGIRVNSVSPGSVDTRMLREAAPQATPAMTVDEVAEVILFLASDRSRPINGQNLHVFGT